MASEQQIKAYIEQIVSAANGYCAIWTIGVTDDPARRRSDHGNPSVWYQWNADTETVARNVESYFIAKGMKGAPGGLGRMDYVYVFI